MAESGDNTDAPKPRGRKRRPGHTEAILEAAGKQLLEVGFDRFRMQDVATRAGCGIGAIYRRWSNKEALISAAIRAMPPSPGFHSGNAREDLRAVVRRECDRYARHPDRVPGMVSAMQADPGIRAAVREGYSVESFRSALAGVLGDDHPHLPLLAELTPAVLLLRASFAPEQLVAEETTEAILALVDALVPPGR
jgi:AcrR family transcriptional regulator